MVDYKDPHQRLFLSTLLMKLQFHLSTFNQYQSPAFKDKSTKDHYRVVSIGRTKAANERVKPKMDGGSQNVEYRRYSGALSGDEA